MADQGRKSKQRINKGKIVTDMTNQTVNAKNRNKTYELVICAIFIALTYVATWLINIRLPFMGSGGLIHLGNVPLLVAAMLYGRKTGAVAGAFYGVPDDIKRTALLFLDDNLKNILSDFENTFIK